MSEKINVIELQNLEFRIKTWLFFSEPKPIKSGFNSQKLW